ncbi:MAG: hypothetical protein ACJ71M_04470 [Nitrososphaeraceae archaeon]
MSKKPLYACGMCGLYFTRRYNANRHNRNLHYNKADIIPFQEYMLGRMSGKYMPGNPSSYRIKDRSTSGSDEFISTKIIAIIIAISVSKKMS